MKNRFPCSALMWRMFSLFRGAFQCFRFRSLRFLLLCFGLGGDCGAACGLKRQGGGLPPAHKFGQLVVQCLFLRPDATELARTVAQSMPAASARNCSRLKPSPCKRRLCSATAPPVNKDLRGNLNSATKPPTTSLRRARRTSQAAVACALPRLSAASSGLYSAPPMASRCRAACKCALHWSAPPCHQGQGDGRCMLVRKFRCRLLSQGLRDGYKAREVGLQLVNTLELCLAHGRQDLCHLRPLSRCWRCE